MTNPLISIIVPVYNVSKYLHRCLDSVLNQTFKNFECICINDWSTDNSLEILNEYAKKDKRIIVFSQKNNWLSATRNVWLKHARWEFLVFIDSDDFIKKDYIETFINSFSTWDYDMVVGWYIKYTWKSESDVFVKDNLISILFNTPVAWRMFKHSIIKKNNLEFPVWLIREDSFFNTNFYNLTNKIKVIQYVWYYYFIENPTSLTHTFGKKFDPKFTEWLEVMNNIKPLDDFHRECKEYFLIKSIIVYLLYSGRSATSCEFLSEYKRLFWWLKKNIPNYRKNKYIYKAIEPSFLYQWCIWGFLLIDKLWLMKLFSKIYCKNY